MEEWQKDEVQCPQLQIIATQIIIFISWMYADEKNCQAMPEATGAFFTLL